MNLHWRDDAACTNYPPGWWFPTKHSPNTKEALAARRVCWGCPVIQPCAQVAIDTKASDAIYAGVYLGMYDTTARNKLRRIAGVK